MITKKALTWSTASLTAETRPDFNDPGQCLWKYLIERGKSMRVLVTGGAGFIGSHLCDALLAEGNHVVCVDNLLTGRLSNVEHLRREPRFEFVQADITSPFD